MCCFSSAVNMAILTQKPSLKCHMDTRKMMRTGWLSLAKGASSITGPKYYCIVKMAFYLFIFLIILQVQSYRFTVETIKIWTKPIESPRPSPPHLQLPDDYHTKNCNDYSETGIYFYYSTCHCTCPLNRAAINKSNLSAVSLGWPHFTAPPCHYVSPPPLHLLALFYCPPLIHTHAHSYTHKHSALRTFLNSSFLFILLQDLGTH